MSAAATIRATTLEVRGSHLGAPSAMPPRGPMRVLPRTVIAGAGHVAEPITDPPLYEDLERRAAYGRIETPLPYALLSDYDRGDHDLSIPAVELSNGVLTALVLPTLGGRIWSLFDHTRDRELLHRNEVLRFANFGLTDAWFAGGIEWNLGSTGHTAMSCLPMHAAVLDTPVGPVLRLWEWERTRDLVVQVDLSLEGDRLRSSTRITNPDPVPKPLYWWTNIAVPETPGTRVLIDSEHAWRTDYSGTLRLVPVPFPDDDVDISVSRNSSHAADYFHHLPTDRNRCLVSVEPDGRGFGQTSTIELTGRKLFLWGHGTAGSNWQEWLSGPGSAYLEIQAGRCTTQLEHDRLDAQATIAWTESFGAVDLDPTVVGGEYAVASTAARSAVLALEPPGRLDAFHRRWLAEVADLPATPTWEGTGWGAVELTLREQAGWAAIPFPSIDDEAPAVLAAARGADVDAPPWTPGTPVWMALLEAAPETWWTACARGVLAETCGDPALAVGHFTRSVELQPNPVALRGLAHLSDPDRATELFARARELAPADRRLLTEQLGHLLDCGDGQAALAVIESAEPALREHGRTRLLEARAHLLVGSPDRTVAILDDLVVEDLAEGEPVLSDLWRAARPGVPLPGRLDYRMADEPDETTAGESEEAR